MHIQTIDTPFSLTMRGSACMEPEGMALQLIFNKSSNTAYMAPRTHNSVRSIGSSFFNKCSRSTEKKRGRGAGAGQPTYRDSSVDVNGMMGGRSCIKSYFHLNDRYPGKAEPKKDLGKQKAWPRGSGNVTEGNVTEHLEFNTLHRSHFGFRA